MNKHDWISTKEPAAVSHSNASEGRFFPPTMLMRGTSSMSLEAFMLQRMPGNPPPAAAAASSGSGGIARAEEPNERDAGN